MSLTFKRHYPLLVLLVLVTLGLSLGIGNQRVTAIDSASSAVTIQAAGLDVPNEVSLFDDTLVHNIQILMDEADYDTMLTTYQQTGEKDYFHADVIIDGVRLNDVGIRLKGNASLMTALGGRGDRMGQGQGGEQLVNPGLMPQDGQLPFDPENMPQRGQRPQPPAGMDIPNPEDLPADRQGGFMPFGGGTGTAIPDGEVKIPLMIKFDEFVAGQTYQGYSSFAIRTYGTSYDAAMLQEPVTNAMFRLAGLPATLTAYAGVALNDQAEQLYTISEVINQTYLQRNFTYSDGVLYKAELGSTLSYQGDDPSTYTDSFTQQTRKNDADLAPLIEFMRFLSQSDDATFESQLPDYLDVDSFATYLALCSLLVNNDSIIGMNNNYYLYYDDLSERFTLLYWDGNESLSKLGGGATASTSLLDDQTQRSFRAPMGGGSNTLLARFVANPTFYALYEQKVAEVYQQVYASGAITAQVEQYADLVRLANSSRDLVDPSAYDAAVTSVLDFITQRMETLTFTPET
ncbi:MAG TPA: CotH kinase family protein [Anaerolineales bacterium]|nr:CotH kinase family protein [Anaerolineales bacterium]